MKARRQAEELRTTNDGLATKVVGLKRRTRELALIKELGELLATCRTAEEFGDVVAQMAPQLFPSGAGALYFLEASRREIEISTFWGSEPQASFGPDKCWAVRRGRIHFFETNGIAPRCAHVAATATDSLCIPMFHDGENIGLVHLWRSDDDAAEGARPVSISQGLAISVAECIGLNLANLRLRESLRDESIRDPLTDLYNRRYAEESLNRELLRAKRRNLSVGIVMIDIDHFKTVNDDFGHEVGDMVLRTMAEFFRNHLRGEEFLLVLPDATQDNVYNRAEKLRQGASRLSVVPQGAGTTQSVTISMGIAMYPEHGSEPRELVRVADMALYEAKADGRDRVVVADTPRATKRAKRQKKSHE